MTLKRLLPILLLFTACAPLGSVPSDSWERRELWDEAHGYFATRDYERADSVFQLLAREYPHTNEGRESLFYLGAIHLDARNPGFDPKPAEEWLERYLAADSEHGRVARRPEGETLHQLAHQLNLPMEERIPALQDKPQTRIVIRAEPVQSSTSEVERLRRELNARETEVKQLKEELDRIRRTLTGGQ
ncbi:MAG TPA: hypothetical protein VF167_18735 [Longimicrobiaceae bacterium]